MTKHEGIVKSVRNGKYLLSRFLLPLILINIQACAGKKMQNTHAEKSNKNSVEMDLKGIPIEQFDESNIHILKRYLIGNSRWDYRIEKGKEYAIRKESENGILTRYSGFSYSHDSLEIIKGETKIFFGKPLAEGSQENKTYAENGKGVSKVKLAYETNLISSDLIISSKLVDVEIKESSKNKSRIYTQQVLEELKKELQVVLDNQLEIEIEGVINNEVFYPIRYDSMYFEVLNASQPGSYFVRAAYNSNEDGEVFIRAYAVGYQKQLSEGELNASLKPIGWATSGEKFFSYENEIKIYEGAYSKPFRASFELWFRSHSGGERKIGEKTRVIKGWDRKNAYKMQKQASQ